VKKPTVLVTGAGGFLGKYVSRYYSLKGYKVLGIGHGILSQKQRTEWGINSYLESDITLKNLCELSEKPEIIIHCAGTGSIGYSVEHPYDDFNKNVMTTAAVLEYMRTKSQSSVLVFPSSAAVYGNTHKCTPIEEQTQKNPISPYGVNKLLAEDLVRSFCRIYDLSASIIRFFSIYGPELKKQLLWDACLKITRGNFSFSGTGNEIRDWIYIDDAVCLIEKMGENATTQVPVVNGGTGHGISVTRVLSLLISQFKVDNKPDFTGEVRSGDPYCLIADITEAQSYGWYPRIPFDEGCNMYYSWFLKEAF